MYHLNTAGLVVREADSAIIPNDPKNADWRSYEAWKAAGNVAQPEIQAITADDVRAEAQRRIVALTGTVDLISCMIKQSNANMRANRLNDKRISALAGEGEPLTAQEQAEAQALRAFNVAIEAIRAASNSMEGNPPTDYAADSRWP